MKYRLSTITGATVSSAINEKKQIEPFCIHFSIYKCYLRVVKESMVQNTLSVELFLSLTLVSSLVCRSRHIHNDIYLIHIYLSESF